MSTRRDIQGAGVRLATYTQGDPARPPLVLMHGYPDTHATWDEVAARLERDFFVIRYDVRGAGASERPQRVRDYAMAELSADLDAVLATYAPGRRVHLVGHDWGGIQLWDPVCAEGAADRFASFTTLSGPCLDHIGAGLRGRVLQDLTASWRQIRASWYVAFFQIPGFAAALWRSQGARYVENFERTEGVAAEKLAPTLIEDGVDGIRLYRANMPLRLARPRVRRTAVPVRQIVPRDDAYVTPVLADMTTSDEVASLDRVEVEGGHWIHRRAPDAIAELIREHAFLH